MKRNDVLVIEVPETNDAVVYAGNEKATSDVAVPVLYAFPIPVWQALRITSLFFMETVFWICVSKESRYYSCLME